VQDHERAARLFGFADAELEACGQTWVEPERSYRQQGLGTIKRQLGWRAEILYDSGRVADREEIAALALQPSRARSRTSLRTRAPRFHSPSTTEDPIW
jgi:hypothetical protein